MQFLGTLTWLSFSVLKRQPISPCCSDFPSHSLVPARFLPPSQTGSPASVSLFSVPLFILFLPLKCSSLHLHPVYTQSSSNNGSSTKSKNFFLFDMILIGLYLLFLQCSFYYKIFIPVQVLSPLSMGSYWSQGSCLGHLCIPSDAG